MFLKIPFQIWTKSRLDSWVRIEYPAGVNFIKGVLRLVLTENRNVKNLHENLNIYLQVWPNGLWRWMQKTLKIFETHGQSISSTKALVSSASSSRLWGILLNYFRCNPISSMIPLTSKPFRKTVNSLHRITELLVFSNHLIVFKLGKIVH